MIEAVEYRIALLQARLYLTAAAVLVTAAQSVIFISWALDPSPTVVAAAVLPLYIIALVFAVAFNADTKDGYCRAVGNWFGDEYEDPPLNDWRENLEQREAFATKDGNVNTVKAAQKIMDPDNE